MDAIEKQFLKFVGMECDDPYQFICDYYYDYISQLSKKDKKYQPVIDMLNIGINNCSIWNNSMLNKHFVQVYRTIQHCK